MQSSEIVRVNNDQKSATPPNDWETELIAEYDENGVMRPDERLSEAFPDEFATYCEHFVEFFPRSPYFVKTTYDDASQYAGWPMKKSRKKRLPLALIDNGNWLNKTDCVERHLDYEQWLLFKQTTDNYRIKRTGDFYWLGLSRPKKTKFHGIDLDNKRVIGVYGEPILPVVHMPLDHYKAMKRIYDAFPNRIWCITSETLGLDIVERHNLSDTGTIHDRVKRTLSRIGLGETEVHPMQGRCKRRPFGEHYRTITKDGVLDTWQTQLDHYLNPGPTPDFDHICRTLLNAVLEQWQCWQRWGDAKNKSVNVEKALQPYEKEFGEVEGWLNDGCPLTEPATSVVADDLPTETTSNIRCGRRQQNKSTNVCDFTLRELRNGNWAKGLEQIAKHGLPCDDCVGNVAHELAKFLWWIELYGLSEDVREREVLQLLMTFVESKHNGHITRWNDSNKSVVFKQLVRCLQLAKRLDVHHRSQSLETFALIRQKRQTGQYSHVIRLKPLITGSPSAVRAVGNCLESLNGVDGGHSRQDGKLPSTSPPLFPSSTFFSVGGLSALDVPLPQTIVDLIDQQRGRAKPHQYATRLLNYLFRTKAVCRLPHKALTELLGYQDRKRTTAYNNILIKAGLLEKNHYIRGQRTCGYWLTKAARQLFDEAKQEDTGAA